MADIPVHESDAGTHITVTVNGQTSFSFDFLIYRAEQLRVLYYAGGVGLGVELDYPADFSVSGLANPMGGTFDVIGLATTAGDRFYAWRSTPIEREHDWQNEGDYKADLVNAEQDQIFMIQQELRRDLALAVSVGPGETPPTIGQIDGWVEAASNSAAAALQSENNAAASELAAAGSALAASGSAGAAAGSANAAAIAKGDAEAARDAAAGSAVSASTSAGIATGAAEDAEDARDLASGYAGAASNSAGLAAADRIQTGLDRTQTGLDAAATGADRIQTGLDAAAATSAQAKAQEWATKPEDQPVEPGLFSAFHWAAKAAALVTGGVAGAIHGASSKATPADADEFALVDSADGWSLKKLTWANIKAALSSVFLPKAGGTMTGDLNMGGKKVINADMSDLVGTTAGTLAAGDDARLISKPLSADAQTLSPAEQAQVAQNLGIMGVGQTWQNLTASRAVGTTYQNTTGKPIEVSVSADATTAGVYLQVSTNGSTWINVGHYPGLAGVHVTVAACVVPPNHYYRVGGGTATLQDWAELR